jgi:hypothetical protein
MTAASRVIGRLVSSDQLSSVSPTTYGVDRSQTSRPYATVRPPYSDRISLCARMFTRTPSHRSCTWLAANTAWAACARGQARDYDQRPAAVNPLGSTTSHLLPSTRGLGWPLRLAANGMGRRLSEAVDGTAHAERTAIEHVRVHHRRADIRVSQQLLHGPNVIAILEQVSRKRMPFRVFVLSYFRGGCVFRAFVA